MPWVFTLSEGLYGRFTNDSQHNFSCIATTQGHVDKPVLSISRFMHYFREDVILLHARKHHCPLSHVTEQARNTDMRVDLCSKTQRTRHRNDDSHIRRLIPYNYRLTVLPVAHITPLSLYLFFNCSFPTQLSSAWWIHRQCHRHPSYPAVACEERERERIAFFSEIGRWTFRCFRERESVVEIRRVFKTWTRESTGTSSTPWWPGSARERSAERSLQR